MPQTLFLALRSGSPCSQINPAEAGFGCVNMDHYDLFEKVACQPHHEWGDLTAEAVHKKVLQPSQRYILVGKREETESLRLFVRVIILVACVFGCI